MNVLRILNPSLAIPLYGGNGYTIGIMVNIAEKILHNKNAEKTILINQ